MPEDHRTEKRCGRCKEVKPITEFGKVRGKARSYCRRCHSASTQNPDTRDSKRCPGCDQHKPIYEFSRCGNRFQSWCRSCSHAACARRREVEKATGRSRIRDQEDYKQRRRWAKLLKNYGFSRDDYESMMRMQNNRCKICGREETEKCRGQVLWLSVDHDHVTGKVRALLCRRCNAGLSSFREKPDVLRRAADYLEHHLKSR